MPRLMPGNDSLRRFLRWFAAASIVDATIRPLDSSGGNGGTGLRSPRQFSSNWPDPVSGLGVDDPAGVVRVVVPSDLPFVRDGASWW